LIHSENIDWRKGIKLGQFTLFDYERLQELTSVHHRQMIFSGVFRQKPPPAPRPRGLMDSFEKFTNADGLDKPTFCEWPESAYQNKLDLLATEIRENVVFRDYITDTNYKKALREFRRLKTKGMTRYVDVFAECRLVNVFAKALGEHFMYECAKLKVRHATLETRESGQQAAKKLINLMKNSGLKLDVSVDAWDFRRGLEWLAAPQNVNTAKRAPRNDSTTLERQSVARFARLYGEQFGHVSAAIVSSFAAFIEYEVPKENLRSQIKPIANEVLLPVPEMYSYKGGIESAEDLPFSMGIETHLK
jgi:hypothetical protein